MILLTLASGSHRSQNNINLSHNIDEGCGYALAWGCKLESSFDFPLVLQNARVYAEVGRGPCP